MKTPNDGTKIYEMPLSTFWIDKDGILHSISKNVPRTLDNTKQLMEFARAILHGNRAYMLADFSNAGSLERPARDYIKKEAKSFYNALAVVTKSSLVRLMGTFISILIPPTIPTRIFTSEKEARKWLLHLIEKDQQAISFENSLNH